MLRFSLKRVWLALAASFIVMISAGCETFDRPGAEIGSSSSAAAVAVAGTIFSQSDVTGLPDIPLERAAVIAVAAAQFETLLGEVGDYLAREGSHFLRMTVEAEVFEKYVTDAGQAAANGRYTLSLPPGDYMLCIGNLDEALEQITPFLSHGCFELTVAEASLQTVDVYVNRGGVSLRNGAP